MTEVVDFPDLELVHVQAKIDTGAYTSALHCKDICLIENEHGTMLSFYVIEPGGILTRRIYSDTFTQRTIKNSFGMAEKRYIIKTKIILFGSKIQAEFSLADREQMRYPVLLGRKLLRNRFVVDVSQKNLSQQTKISSKLR